MDAIKSIWLTDKRQQQSVFHSRSKSFFFVLFFLSTFHSSFRLLGVSDEGLKHISLAQFQSCVIYWGEDLWHTGVKCSPCVRGSMAASDFMCISPLSHPPAFLSHFITTSPSPSVYLFLQHRCSSFTSATLVRAVVASHREEEKKNWSSLRSIYGITSSRRSENSLEQNGK